MLEQAGSAPSPLHDSRILNFPSSTFAFSFNRSGTLLALPAGSTDEAKNKNQLFAEVGALIYGLPVQGENTELLVNSRFDENAGSAEKSSLANGKPLGSGKSHKDDIDPRKLFCGNLDASIDRKILFDHFKRFGRITGQVRVMQGRERRPGCGYVSFETAEQAMAAMQAMNGTQLGSKKIFVRVDLPRELRGQNTTAEQMMNKSNFTPTFHDKATPQPHINPLILQQLPLPIPKQAHSFPLASNGASTSRMAAASPRQNAPIQPGFSGPQYHASNPNRKGEGKETTLKYNQREPDAIDDFITSITSYPGTSSPLPASQRHSPNARAGPPKSPIQIANGRSRKRPTALSIIERIDAEEANRQAIAEVDGRIPIREGQGFQGGLFTGGVNGLATFGINGGIANPFPCPAQGVQERQGSWKNEHGNRASASGGVMLEVMSLVPTQGTTNAKGGNGSPAAGKQGGFPHPMHVDDEGKGRQEQEMLGHVGNSAHEHAYIDAHGKAKVSRTDDTISELNRVVEEVWPEMTSRRFLSQEPLVIPNPTKAAVLPARVWHATDQPTPKSTAIPPAPSFPPPPVVARTAEPGQVQNQEWGPQVSRVGPTSPTYNRPFPQMYTAWKPSWPRPQVFQPTKTASPTSSRHPSQKHTALTPSPPPERSSNQETHKIPSSSPSATTAWKSLAGAPPLQSESPPSNPGSQYNKALIPSVPSHFDAIIAIEDALEGDLRMRRRRGPLAYHGFEDDVAGSHVTGKKRSREGGAEGEKDGKRRRIAGKLHPWLALSARRVKARGFKGLNAGSGLHSKPDLPWALFTSAGLEPSSRPLKRQRENGNDVVDPPEHPSRSVKHRKRYHLPGVIDQGSNLTEYRRPSLPIVEVYSPPATPRDEPRGNSLFEWVDPTSVSKPVIRYGPGDDGEGSLAKDLGFIAYEVTRICGAALFGMVKASKRKVEKFEESESWRTRPANSEGLWLKQPHTLWCVQAPTTLTPPEAFTSTTTKSIPNFYAGVMASTADEPDTNPYELLNLSSDATDQDIKSAYRKQSLKVHPDRNPNNPDAARKFHELNQAYELLLDPLRRLALDAKLRVTQARKERFKSYDAKRKNLVEELEERERAFKKARVQKQKEEMEAYTSTERIKEEGRRMREEREMALKEAERAKLREEEGRKETEAGLKERGVGAEGMMDVDEPPPLDQFDTTVRLKYSLKSKPDLKSKEAIAEYLAPFGPVDVDSVVFSMKAKKSKSKSKTKNGEESGPTHATALVPFRNISDAYASVTASSTASSSSRVDVKGIEITWVNNKEPAILGWLKKMGKLPTPGTSRSGSAASPNPGPTGTSNGPTPIATPLGAPAGSTPFSSFPTTFSAPSKPPSSSFPGSSSGPAGAGGLDYESLTLLRLRQAERERLEREIREREAEES